MVLRIIKEPNEHEIRFNTLLMLSFTSLCRRRAKPDSRAERGVRPQAELQLREEVVDEVGNIILVNTRQMNPLYIE